MKHIPHEDLRAELLPGPGADWAEIASFAHTWDGYSLHGSIVECGTFANSPRQEGEGLAELRTRLFFEARRYRHFGHPPDEDAMHYIRELVEGIRAIVGERAVEELEG